MFLSHASADKPNPETIRPVHLQIEIVGLERVTEELQTLAQPTCESERYDGSGLDKVGESSAARGRMGNFSKMVPGGFNRGETAFLGATLAAL